MTHISSAARRQFASRANKKAAGFIRPTIRLDGKTVTRLRRLAKGEGTTQVRVIEVALTLLDNKPLLKYVHAWSAERAAKATSGPSR